MKKTLLLAALLLPFHLYAQDPAATPVTPAPAEPAPKRVPPNQYELTPSTPATPPSDPSKFELFLLVGQSNMAGRAPLLDADRAVDPRVLVLDPDGQWVSRGEPIHFDKPAAVGAGLGFPFAKLVADKEPGVTIGLIPCAVGGTPTVQWAPPKAKLYTDAVARARIAMKAGTLKGILWHQGETDSNYGKPETREAFANAYASRLQEILAAFRSDLGAPAVPIVIGELGYYNYKATPLAETVNAQIHTLPQLLPNLAVASADGLKDKGDHLHFDNASQKELAKRYFDAYEGLLAAPAAPTAPAATSPQ